MTAATTPAGTILRDLGLDDDKHADGARLDPDRPCRKPTREDYLRMGVSPDALDGIAA
jgi:hypothetical protein